MSWKEKTGKNLRDEALKHNLSSEGWYTKDGVFREAAVQERVRSAKNSRLARNTWIIALVSAIASIVSAIVAWVAVSI